MKKLNKKGDMWDFLIPVLIALGILVVIVIIVFILKAKGISLIDKIKDLFRFRIWQILL